MPRDYWRCSACNWKYHWAWIPPHEPSNDPGLRIAEHVALVHPEQLLEPIEMERYGSYFRRYQALLK